MNAAMHIMIGYPFETESISTSVSDKDVDKIGQGDFKLGHTAPLRNN